MATTAYAASITIQGDKILVLGAIENGDEFKFFELAEPINRPMTVLLHSQGGFLLPAFTIGFMAKAKGWTTHVDSACNSACALLWLGGSKREKSVSAQIGFHTACDPRTGACTNVDGVGWYLSNLGYGKDVLPYVTSTYGANYRYINDADAKRLNISMITVPRILQPYQLAHVDMQKMPALMSGETLRDYNFKANNLLFRQQVAMTDPKPAHEEQAETKVVASKAISWPENPPHGLEKVMPRPSDIRGILDPLDVKWPSKQ